MCWKTKRPLKRKVAQEDVKCYKVLKKMPKFGIYRSPYMNYEYELGRSESAEFSFRNGVDNGATKIFSGLHSYLSHHKAKWERDNMSSGIFGRTLTVIKCIIPKGAVYFENETREYVSSEIIPIEPLKD